MSPSRRTLAAAVATASTVALAAPALAAGVDVTVVGLGGTRQFSVEDLTGSALTALDLGTGGSKPFRLHVADDSFLPAVGSAGDYVVNATMTNLYLKTGASSYNYATKIPSSDVAIGFGGNPLAGLGTVLDVVPHLSLTGTLDSCADLSSTLQSALGLSSLGAVLDLSNTALTTLCTTIGLTAKPIALQVDSAVQSVTPTISSVLDLPTALGGAVGGTFSNPSFAAGTVGAGDTAGAAGAPTATAVPLMSGTRNLSTNLVSSLTTAINNALAGLPLISSTGAPAKTVIAEVIAELTATGSTATEVALGNVLSTLDATKQATVVNELIATLGTVTTAVPVLGDLLGVTGDSFAFPVLTATPTTPVAGTYGGTMTVTFVQS